jgi:hypothetical protein
MTDFADILSCSHRSHPLIKGPSKTLIEANDGLLYLQMGSYTSQTPNFEWNPDDNRVFIRRSKFSVRRSP